MSLTLKSGVLLFSRRRSEGWPHHGRIFKTAEIKDRQRNSDRGSQKISRIKLSQIHLMTRFASKKLTSEMRGLGYDTIRDAILTCARKPT